MSHHAGPVTATIRYSPSLASHTRGGHCPAHRQDPVSLRLGSGRGALWPRQGTGCLEELGYTRDQEAASSTTCVPESHDSGAAGGSGLEVVR